LLERVAVDETEGTDPLALSDRSMRSNRGGMIS